jgi:uncharacterized membrane protein YhhN
VRRRDEGERWGEMMREERYREVSDSLVVVLVVSIHILAVLLSRVGVIFFGVSIYIYKMKNCNILEGA